MNQVKKNQASTNYGTIATIFAVIIVTGVAILSYFLFDDTVSDIDIKVTPDQSKNEDDKQVNNIDQKIAAKKSKDIKPENTTISFYLAEQVGQNNYNKLDMSEKIPVSPKLNLMVNLNFNKPGLIYIYRIYNDNWLRVFPFGKDIQIYIKTTLKKSEYEITHVLPLENLSGNQKFMVIYTPKPIVVNVIENIINPPQSGNDYKLPIAEAKYATFEIELLPNH